MPVIIDNTKDVSQQIDQFNKNAKSKQTVDVKYFSTKLTGNGRRKNGLFNIDAHTITDFMQETRGKFHQYRYNVKGDENIDNLRHGVFGNKFNKMSPIKEKDFREFEHNLTSITPPVLVLDALDYKLKPVMFQFDQSTDIYHLSDRDNTKLWAKVTSGTVNGEAVSVYAKPIVQSLTLYSKESVTSAKGVTKKTMSIAAQPDMYIMFQTVRDDMVDSAKIALFNNAPKNGFDIDENNGVASIYRMPEYNDTRIDYEAVVDALDHHLAEVVKNSVNKVAIPNLNTHDMKLHIGDLSMVDILTAEANLIANSAPEILLEFAEIYSKTMSAQQKAKESTATLDTIFERGLVGYVQHLDILNEIEDNIIPTDMLAELFETFTRELNEPEMVNRISRHSLRLLLSQRLYELKELRDNDGLYTFEPKNKKVSDAMAKDSRYSVQQKRIVTTTDPLVIGQAGAGSGKSHTLVGRINYLNDQGEDLKQVLVLSFTNIAAININNRFPGVRSETLANMFATIYSATYPSQALSQPSTVANAMRLLNPKSQYFKNLGVNVDELEQYISDFAAHLEQFDQTGFKRVNIQQESKHLSNLIEANLELTEIILNAVEQTTLELQPIIIHHLLLSKSQKLNIPQDYQDLNYIITDESQDISTFEYILLLELTLHYRSQLLIIGDGSQTLYEFRNSDPRYMNALESSNVFTSHKLETNYRSKEEILMYANQFLQVIDANKFANIQLSSSIFTKPTEKSMIETIKITDNTLPGRTMNEYVAGLSEFIEEDVEFREWFLERVRKGEQIAVMGWTRQEVLEAGERIEEMLRTNGLGHIEVTSIMSDRDQPMTLLSKFATNDQRMLRTNDPRNANYMSAITTTAESFVQTRYRHASSKQAAFYVDYIVRHIKEITNTPQWSAWMNDLSQGRATIYQAGSFLIQEMLKSETRKNAMEQHLRKQKDQPDIENCPIILSTIHGTKGLEFDHTVVMFNEAKKGSTSQESLRMMFVALSRAKQSEFIINGIAPTDKRTVSATHAGMFQTPVNTAMDRALEDIAQLQKAQQANATTAVDEPEDEDVEDDAQ